MRDRTVELLRVPAGELRADPRNWRTHPAGQRKALRAVLSDVGFAGAVMARRNEEGHLVLVDGHARVEETAPDVEIPVLVLDVDEKEAAKILATYDPLGAMAERDNEAFAAMVAILDEESSELLSAVFPDHLLDAFRAAEFTPDDIAPIEEHKRKDAKQVIEFEEAEHAVVLAAVAEWRRQSGAKTTAAQAVVAICREWLEHDSARLPS